MNHKFDSKTMFEIKDYSKMSLEELNLEERKLTNLNKVILLFTAILIGAVIYAIYKKSNGFMSVVIPFACAYFLTKNSNKIEEVKNEIKSRAEK